MHLYKIDFIDVEISTNVDKTIEHSFYVSEDTYNNILALAKANDAAEGVIRPDI